MLKVSLGKSTSGKSTSGKPAKPKKLKVRQGDKLQRLFAALATHFQVNKAGKSSRLLLPACKGGGPADLERSAMSYGLADGDVLSIG